MLLHSSQIVHPCFCSLLILFSNIWAWSGIPDLAKLDSCHSFDFLPFGIGYSHALRLSLNQLVLLASFDVQWLLSITCWVTPPRSLEKLQSFSHKYCYHTKQSIYSSVLLHKATFQQFLSTKFWLIVRSDHKIAHPADWHLEMGHWLHQFWENYS